MKGRHIILALGAAILMVGSLMSVAHAAPRVLLAEDFGYPS